MTARIIAYMVETEGSRKGVPVQIRYGSKRKAEDAAEVFRRTSWAKLYKVTVDERTGRYAEKMI